MSRTMLDALEITLILIISVLTLIYNPSLPLLAIPFLLIITLRTIFRMIENGEEK